MDLSEGGIFLEKIPTYFIHLGMISINGTQLHDKVIAVRTDYGDCNTAIKIAITRYCSYLFYKSIIIPYGSIYRILNIEKV